MIVEEGPPYLYRRLLANLDQASRQHAVTKAESKDLQSDRAKAIVEISKLGVPRSTVAKLSGLTGGRVQQILEQAGEVGVTGENWSDPELRRLVAEAIAARPTPSAGVGLRRESTLGPHVGRGQGVAVPLTGDLDEDRGKVEAMIEKLLGQVRSGELDHLLRLTDEELDVVQGNLIDG